MHSDTLIPSVLRQFHDENGHFGRDKTLDIIKRRYSWSILNTDVPNYVVKCQTCKLRNMRPTKFPIQVMDQPHYPMQKVSLDLSGPHPTTSGGNQMILHIVDMYTNWPECFPMVEGTSENVETIFQTEFIPRHGCPRTVLTDNGGAFT